MAHMSDQIPKVDGLKLFVFDLDYTLWPFYVDTHVTPPFKKRDGKVYDAHNQVIKHYPDVPDILKALKELGYKVGIASRTSATDEANELIRLFDWDRYIDCKEIYPGRKTTHMNRLCQKTGTSLDQIVFYDDEHRNIVDLTQMNVCSILVKNGVDIKTLRQGIDEFIKKKESKVPNKSS